MSFQMFHCWRWYAAGYVNVTPSHMPIGWRDHMDYIKRLAARGQKDES